MILDCITNSITGKNENEINIDRIYSLTPLCAFLLSRGLFRLTVDALIFVFKAGLPEPTSTVIQPGDREDNRWYGAHDTSCFVHFL